MKLIPLKLYNKEFNLKSADDLDDNEPIQKCSSPSRPGKIFHEYHEYSLINPNNYLLLHY